MTRASICWCTVATDFRDLQEGYGAWIFDGIKGGFLATTSLIAKYGGVSGKKGPFSVDSPDACDLC